MKLDGLTNAQLIEMRQKLEADPTNRQTDSIFMFTPACRKKFDKIDRQIQHNIRAAKLARGEYVNDEGYSGAKQNRRR